MMINNIELDEKNIKEKLFSIVSKYDSSISEIDDEDVLLEVKIDDLSKTQIAMEIERTFDIEFEFEDIGKIEKAKDLVDFIVTYNR